MKIHFLAVCRNLGLLLLVLSAMLLLAAAFSAVQLFVEGAAGSPERPALPALLLSAAIGVVTGGLLYYLGRRGGGHFGYRESLLLVALGWLGGAALAALPFYFWSQFRPDSSTLHHDFDGYIDCYFEAMSGLTTTGATILTASGTLPNSILLWRATTHWLGGLGIVVLFVAVLPALGVGGRRLFRIESPGPSPEGVRPRIQDTARVLWLIYLGLTAAEILALWLCGMSLFDAVCHTFATLATGGFSTHDASIAAFESSAIHLVLILFMFLAGVNFSLYFAVYQKRWRTLLQDTEFRCYAGIVLVAFALISVCRLMQISQEGGLSSGETPLWITLRDVLFQVVSIQTTTGFCTADFDQWGFIAKATLVALMFVGASAGSTGGGIKVIRILVGAKLLFAEVEHAFRPNVVRSVKVGRATVATELKIAVLVYILGIGMLFAVGTVLLMVFERDLDIVSAATATAATLNNIGPGLAKVGATQNYAWFGDGSKVVMSGLMALGRLEVYAIIVLFSPRFWRGE